MQYVGPRVLYWVIKVLRTVTCAVRGPEGTLLGNQSTMAEKYKPPMLEDFPSKVWFGLLGLTPQQQPG